MAKVARVAEDVVKGLGGCHGRRRAMVGGTGGEEGGKKEGTDMLQMVVIADRTCWSSILPFIGTDLKGRDHCAVFSGVGLSTCYGGVFRYALPCVHV